MNYQKLPGHRRGFLRGSSLWLAPDHLLLVKSLRFREEYQRFFFRDIQSIVIADGPRFHLSTRAAAVGTVWLVCLLAGWKLAPWAPAVLGSAGVLFLLSWIYVSAAQSCSCRIQTAVSREPLPSIYRKWTAREFLDQLEPHVQKAQGPLPEGWALLLDNAPPAAPAAPAQPLPGAPPPSRLRRHTIAADVFIATLIEGAVYNWTRGVQWGLFALALMQVACACVIFLEYRRGILRMGMQRLAIVTLIAMGVSFYIRQVMAGVTAGGAANTAFVPLPSYQLLRRIDAVVYLALALAGVALLLLPLPKSRELP